MGSSRCSISGNERADSLAKYGSLDYNYPNTNCEIADLYQRPKGDVVEVAGARFF